MTLSGPYVALRALARRRFGLSFPPVRAANFERGVAEVCRSLALTPAELLARMLAHDPVAEAQLASALTVGETYFFRDPPHFDRVREHLARLAAADPHRQFVLWSAGCATGEEAWTLAIMAHEVLGPSAAWRVRVLGTDLDARALDHAARGVYRAWSFRQGQRPDPRWFTRDGSAWRVSSGLRRMVRFRPLNLRHADDAPRHVDVALCRNVLLYFDADGIAAAARALDRALAPDGLLITGPSDPSIAAHVALRASIEQGVLLYRPPRSTAAPPPIERTAPSTAPAAPHAVTADRTHDRTAADDVPRETDAPIDDTDDSDDLDALDRAIARDPLDLDAWTRRALARLDRCDTQGALDDALRATLLGGRAPWAHTVAAMAAHAADDRDRAALHARNALALLTPDDDTPAHAAARAVCLAIARRRLSR